MQISIENREVDNRGVYIFWVPRVLSFEILLLFRLSILFSILISLLSTNYTPLNNFGFLLKFFVVTWCSPINILHAFLSLQLKLCMTSWTFSISIRIIYYSIWKKIDRETLWNNRTFIYWQRRSTLQYFPTIKEKKNFPFPIIITKINRHY